ncbi:protein of unknown function [Xenorhabdus doucetiae]|uniref:Uncharacterized protein n=1 Tax=Xenorhabdus doucetiae TaxID=351671 RepID=A0A068QTW8_9GAMM|nr:protein of unknown function [Xenorhabdus doucetiae]
MSKIQSPGIRLIIPFTFQIAAMLAVLIHLNRSVTHISATHRISMRLRFRFPCHRTAT